MTPIKPNEKMYSFKIHYKVDGGYDFITVCANTKREAKSTFADWCRDNGKKCNIEYILVCYDERDAAENGENYGTPEEYYERLKLRERLFWMNLNNGGVDEIGYLMTMEQLCEELPEKGSPSEWDDIIPTGEMTPEDVDKLITYGRGMFDGEYSANTTFTVREVLDMEDLISLLTWEDYDFTKGATAVELNAPYPEYVPENLRLSACVHGNEPGWTSENLPKSGEKNETVARYAAELGLDMISGLRYEYTNEELAAIETSQILQSGYLSLDTFVLDILSTYQIAPPAFKAVDIEWDAEKDIELPTEIPIPEGMYCEADIDDYLTEVTGYCHKGYLLTEADDMQKEEQKEEELEL